MRMKNKNAHKTGFIITNLTIKPVFIQMWFYEYMAFVCDWAGRTVYPTDFFSI